MGLTPCQSCPISRSGHCASGRRRTEIVAAGGNVIGVVIAIRDITERRRAARRMTGYTGIYGGHADGAAARLAANCLPAVDFVVAAVVVPKLVQ